MRLERLWAGEFGDTYTDRNLSAGLGRARFWDDVLQECRPRSVLEVGCNRGANLRWIVSRVPGRICGVDINSRALNELRALLPSVAVVRGPARALPFRDETFDLALTLGVLIHQPPDSLPLVMGEIVRCSRRFVLCGEYFAPTPTQVPYRGETNALFKRDFGALYAERFSTLKLRRQGFLGRAEGFDDVTYWLFEKSS